MKRPDTTVRRFDRPGFRDAPRSSVGVEEWLKLMGITYHTAFKPFSGASPGFSSSADYAMNGVYADITGAIYLSSALLTRTFAGSVPTTALRQADLPG